MKLVSSRRTSKSTGTPDKESAKLARRKLATPTTVEPTTPGCMGLVDLPAS